MRGRPVNHPADTVGFTCLLTDKPNGSKSFGEIALCQESGSRSGIVSYSRNEMLRFGNLGSAVGDNLFVAFRISVHFPQSSLNSR